MARQGSTGSSQGGAALRPAVSLGHGSAKSVDDLLAAETQQVASRCDLLLRSLRLWRTELKLHIP